MESVTLQLLASDRSVLAELFGVDDPRAGSQSKIEGIGEVVFFKATSRPGMAFEDIVISIAINVTTGVPMGLLANWIFESLSKRGVNGVRMGTDPIVKTNEEEIAHALMEQLKAFYRRM